MTALVFSLQPDQVCLVMDTLVVAAETKMPLGLRRKFLVSPERRLIIAGTGLATLVQGWQGYVASSLEVRSIDELDRIAPTSLYAASKEVPAPSSITTTLYHFGYSPSERRYIGLVYRSIAGFASERLPDAIGIQPTVPVVVPEDIRFPAFLLEIMLAQHRQDRSLPLDRQIGIGGEVDFVAMTNGNLRIETIHRFSTYEADVAKLSWPLPNLATFATDMVQPRV
jgi:hypothetical protein